MRYLTNKEMAQPHEHHRVSIFRCPGLKHPAVLRCRTCDLAWVKWIGHKDFALLQDLVEGPDPGPKNRKKIRKKK